MSGLLTLFYKGVSLIESGSILGEHSNIWGVVIYAIHKL